MKTKSEKQWLMERSLAYKKAKSLIKEMPRNELLKFVESIAKEFSYEAGNLTNHDDAMPDLIRESALLFLISKLK